MSDTVALLERLRAEVARLEGLVGNLGDYIDRGNPDVKNLAAAQDDMARYLGEREIARCTLSDAVAEALAAAPEALAAWVGWHMAWCRRIVAEAVPPSAPDEPISDQAVRVFVAGQTLAEWQNVLKGGQSYVHINDAYLGDYATAASAWLAAGAVERAERF